MCPADITLTKVEFIKIALPRTEQSNQKAKQSPSRGGGLKRSRNKGPWKHRGSKDSSSSGNSESFTEMSYAITVITFTGTDVNGYYGDHCSK